ncbi:cytochrome-c oxidase, cbb3-type subunit II [Rhizobium beringeri]
MASILDKHQILEKNATLLLVGSLLVVSIGGIVEIAPLFYLQNTIEKVEGMRPYTPLELAGRNIYIREGCYLCHSQMIRPFRDEVERYGHYSLAAESMYDHPFPVGIQANRAGSGPCRRTLLQRMACPASRRSSGSRAGVDHAALRLPQRTEGDGQDVGMDLKANEDVGVPYNDDMLANAEADMKAQADPNADTTALLARYPKAKTGDFDGDPAALTEMDALVSLPADARNVGRFLDLRRCDRLPMR